MSFDFDSLVWKPPTKPPRRPEPVRRTTVVHCKREPFDAADGLDADAILELWNERAAIMASENPVKHTNVPPIAADADFETQRAFWKRVRRFWELNAAADLANQHGDYVLTVIQPYVTKEETRDAC